MFIPHQLKYHPTCTSIFLTTIKSLFMNRIVTGFTALIAILAMSFTFSTKYTNVGSSISMAVDDGCYTAIYVYVIANNQTLIFNKYSNAPAYQGYVVINNYDDLVGFPYVLRSANSGSYNLRTWPIGAQVGDVSSQCPYTSNPPVCCYNIHNNKVNWIRFGVYTP